MIHPQELRIGNWIQTPLGDYMQVKQLGHTDNPDYIFAKSDKGFGQNEFQPIPLTPELLEKCGFEKTHFGNCYRIDNGIFSPWLEKEEDYFDIIVGDPEYSIGEIKYLHQLQNIYKSLTNKELNIQL